MTFAPIAAALSTGLLAGIFLMGTLGVRQAAASLEPTAHLLFRQQLIRHLSQFMPWLMVFAIVATVLAVYQSESSFQKVVLVVVLGLTITTFIITVTINVPLNQRFLRWTPTTLPSDWRGYVRRWDRADSLRCGVATIAFLFTLVAGR